MSDIRPTDPRAEYLGLHGRRRRSPRFALLILIMFAILSVILAITVAFILI